MRKWLVGLVCLCMLSGCSAPVYETLGQVEHVSGTLPQMREICLQLPEDALLLTAAEERSFYVCREYDIAVQSFASGDLNGTLRQISGFSAGQLTLLETSCGDHKRYDMVWVAAGESGDVLCRGSLIDDGVCHYTVVAMADAALAASVKEEWNELFGSFCLEEI